MKMSKFLLISLLLLVPCEVLQKCGPKAVLCEYASSYDIRKKEFNDENASTPYYKDYLDPISYQTPRPVKVRYDPTPEEKCQEKKKINIKQEQLCRREIETVKEEAKRQAKKFEQHCKSVKIPVKVELSKDDSYKLPMVRGKVVCAECEQCELQVKAGGEGVMLKCTGCRSVPPDEVMFPADNNRRVVKLP